MYTCYNLFVALDTGHQEISNDLHHYWRGADHGVVVFLSDHRCSMGN